MRIAIPVVFVALAACGGGWVEETEDGLRHLEMADTTGRSGRIHARFDVLEGEEAMLITSDPASPHRSVFLALTAPDGTRVFDVDTEVASGRLKTGGRYTSSVVSLNWPILDSDLALLPGRWDAEIAVVDLEYAFARGVDTAVHVLVKDDDDLGGGRLDVTVIYLGTTRDDDELHRAVDVAVDVWTALYASIGITLVVSYGESDLDGLPIPGSGGGDDYVALSASTPLRSVPVVIVPEFEDQPGIYGIAGAIPGPLVPSQRSAVVVSAVTNSGSDLVFDAQEERLLGETLAHEVLHFLGLFHPVEPEWDQWDALDDTPECGSQITCVRDLGTNLMFPFPVCTSSSCRAQDQLTEDQGGVANRYTGVQ